MAGIDLLAYAYNATCHLQVKAWHAGSASLDATRFARIEFDGDSQVVRGLRSEPDGDLVYAFMKLGRAAGEDRFFILLQHQLQKIILKNYSDWLGRHGGVRPHNPQTTHTAAGIEDLDEFEGNRSQVTEQFEGSQIGVSQELG